MATVRREIEIQAEAAAIWDAARDVGALHTRLVPGFVSDTRMLERAEPLTRRVTFASGVELEEAIVAIDEAERRVVWTIQAEGVRHHNGALQVFALGPGRSQVVWTADVLPDALADRYGPLMAAGLEAMKRTLETPATVEA